MHDYICKGRPFFESQRCWVELAVRQYCKKINSIYQFIFKIPQILEHLYLNIHANVWPRPHPEII